MKLWLIVSLFVSLLYPNFAIAQLDLQPILDHGPIRFGIGIEIELNKFGSDVTASATASAVLRDVQNIVLAARPQINRRLLCSDGKQRASITSLDFAGPFGSSDLVLNVLLHVRQCSLGLYEGDVRISAPISVRKKGPYSIILAAAPLEIVPQGVSALGFIRVSDAEVKSSVDSEVAPLMGGAIKRLNDWVSNKLQEPSFQKFIRQYHFEVQSAQLIMQGGDLVLATKFSSQMSIAEANKRFSDLVPLNASW
jgi:hypothetical protein